MILLVIGIVVGFYMGYSMQHNIRVKNSYDILIECNNEEDMKTVMRQLKGIKNIEECQKD